MDYNFGVYVLWMLLIQSVSLRARRIERNVENVMLREDFNKNLLKNIPRPYQTVIPEQIRRNKLTSISTQEHRIRHHGTHEHYEHVTIQIKLDGRKYKIKLERNKDLLSSGIMIKHYMAPQQQVISKTVEHCFYHGYVKRDEWSSVAVSTCNGIRGVIQMHNESFIIQPLAGDEGMQHPHVVYRATVSPEERCGNSVGQWLPFHELHVGEFIKKLKRFRAESLQGEIKDRTEPQIIKLALVLDKAVYLGLNFSHVEMTRYAIEIVNIVDLYYKDLNIQFSLTFLEYWNVADQFIVSPKLRELLEKFLIFKSKALQGIDFDMAYFITGTELEDKSIGLAIPDSLCTDRAVGVCQSPKPFQPQQTATILAHMIGHNLGIKHDEDSGCECNDDFGCIMSEQVLGAGGYHSRQFSSCSKSDLNNTLNMNITSCLTQSKQQAQINFPQSCGNKIVERGEECDCGSEEDCLKTDPCCDPDTCLLRFWAQCRSGQCCQNCTVLPRNTMCRDKQTDCDVPEVCDGLRGECPSNNYLQDGHPCRNDTGYCLGGICPSSHEQCQHIWGPDSRGGDDQCFERFNPTGNFNGHCGKDEATGTYAKCSAEDMLCGLLHCEFGNKEPLNGPDKGFSKTTVYSNDQEYECKSVHGPTMMDMPNMGLVQDGTKCGNNKICISVRCVSTDRFPPLSCPNTNQTVICSGNGLCTKDNTCFCHEGWSGPDCTIKVNITTKVHLTTTPVSIVTSTTKTVFVIPPVQTEINDDNDIEKKDPTEKPVLAEMQGLSTMWLIIILASVIGGLIIIMSCTLFCYRRKTPTIKLSKAVSKSLMGKKGEKDDSNNSLASHYITFGPLPHRGDKLFGKKKKKRLSSGEESEIGDLPPPPIIITDPNSILPEKGILKNSFIRLSDDYRRSSDSNGGSEGKSENDSVGPYIYDEDEDLEAEEIREILGEDEYEPEQGMEYLDNLPESSSFDFMVPPPHPYNFGMPSLQPSPPPPRRFKRLDRSIRSEHQNPSFLFSRIPPPPTSPPRSRVVRLRNLNDLLRQIDRQTIDLSPSPDEPPLQISPSTCTSEDVRSSETENDRAYPSMYNTCSDYSPTSVTSTSTKDAGRPFFGNLSQYILKPNEINLSDDDGELQPPTIDIPPPMNPLNLRNIFNIGHTTVNNRDNDTPLSTQDSSSLNGTSSSKNGGEKSSGYGSEHDPERFSTDDASRSQSASPPSYSAVIRTGPNQIKLLPAGKLQQRGVFKEGGELQKLLDGLPRIDAGSYERSPIQALTSAVHTSSGTLPPPKPLAEVSGENGSMPCIDRSLEEIPQDLPAKDTPRKPSRKSKSKRPISLGVSKHSPESPESCKDQNYINQKDSASKRYSALERARAIFEGEN
ncbi:hypothetical protein SNE40_022640 [Patella caerulea]|uniref:Uncharacterized protein n=2 Tax=Patella caerulea TaxID=87958 RepID=A0AAN8G5U6_PATCE